ncbi:MAG: hypothetical protein ACP5M9_01875 [Candidatus Micrarchaeia archaeon]
MEAYENKLETKEAESHQESVSQHHNPKNNNMRDTLFTNQNLLFIGIVLIILIATVYLRVQLLQFQGFYEPDGFYHFSVIRAAVNNDFVVPKTLSISGWPQHTLVTEPVGLYWVTLFPYYILRFFGVSYYDVMRLVPLLFAIFDVLGAYYLSRFLSKDKVFGLLVMAFVALSAGDAARTSALIYRGDGFITAFLLLTLIFISHLFKTKDKNRKIAFMLLGALSLSICNVVWNGASFADAIVILSLIVFSVFGFVFKKEKMYNDNIYLIGLLIIWILLIELYKAAPLFYNQALTGIYFVFLLIMITIGWIIGYFINKSKIEFFETISKRAIFILFFGLIVGFIIFVGMKPFINQVFINNGFITTNNTFAQTIQELTPPTLPFLFGSFGIALFSTPMSILLAISSLLSNAQNVIWIIMLLTFIPYLFMNIYDSRDWFKGNPRFIFEVKPEMLIIIVYFALTAYLQLFAIRFNSLISVPLAIMSAYTIYWFFALIHKNLHKHKLTQLSTIYSLIILAVLVVIINVAMIIEALFYSFLAVVVLVFISTVIGIIIGFLIINRKVTNLTGIFAYFIVIFILVVLFYDIVYGGTITQADNINPLFLNATTWIKNNTSPNSVFLTLWPDGSVIEGWGNRTSVMDSVGSQNALKADPFATWLYNSSSDTQFIESNVIGSPNYLLVRYNWLLETQGIYTESYLNPKNEGNYSFGLLIPTNESYLGNGSAINFIGSQGYPRIFVAYNNSLSKGESFIQTQTSSFGGTQYRYLPVSYTAFYNQNTLNYTIVNDTKFFNRTVASMVLVVYSNIPRYLPNTNIKLMNVTEAFVFEDGLAFSNMIKFLYFCNDYECTWNNKNATLSLDFINGDTRIYKINYK